MFTGRPRDTWQDHHLHCVDIAVGSVTRQPSSLIRVDDGVLRHGRSLLPSSFAQLQLRLHKQL